MDNSFWSYLETLDPDGTLPHPDAVCGWPEAVDGPTELDGLSSQELLEHALADPDVQAVVEAAEGMQLVRD